MQERSSKNSPGGLKKLLTNQTMQDQYSQKIKLNLKKAAGQLKLIEQMIDDGRYCIDIAQQVNASVGLLKKVNDFILENHLLVCGAKKLNSAKQSDRVGFANELIKAFTIANR